MKFPRQTRTLRGPLDPAAAASVVLLLVIFMLLASLLYTPGVLIQLPDGNPLTVTENPTVAVAVDSAGRCFFENKPVEEAALQAELKKRVHVAARQSQKLTVLLYLDKAVTVEVLSHLEAVIHEVGITQALIAGQPPPFALQQ